MTNCYDEGHVRAYLDGELPPLERAALGAHLVDCATCQDKLGRQRALAVRVRALLPVPPAAPDARAALVRLRAAAEQPLRLRIADVTGVAGEVNSRVEGHHRGHGFADGIPFHLLWRNNISFCKLLQTQKPQLSSNRPTSTGSGTQSG